MGQTPSEQDSANERPAGSAVRSPNEACWVFDVDGCLVDSLTGTSLRPGALRLLEHLAAHGCTVLLWSAGGESYARDRAEAFGLAGLVTSCHSKEGRDAVGCYETAHLPIGRGDAVFVDDRPEELSDRLDLVAVSPYLSPDPHDRGLAAVLCRAGLRWPRLQNEPAPKAR